MAKSKKKKSAVRKALRKGKVRVRKVVLKPKEVVRIVAHKSVFPVVAHGQPGVLEVAAVERARPPKKKMGWLEYIGFPKN